MKETLPYILHTHIVFHMLLWESTKKKKISSYFCPDKICKFLWAAGRCNRHRQSMPSTGSVLGRLTPKREGQGGDSSGTYPSQVQTRYSLTGWAWSLCSGLQKNITHTGPGVSGTALSCTLGAYHLHLNHSDKQTQPKWRAPTKPRGITTFLKDGEHYAHSTVVNRGNPHPWQGIFITEKLL